MNEQEPKEYVWNPSKDAEKQTDSALPMAFKDYESAELFLFGYTILSAFAHPMFSPDPIQNAADMRKDFHGWTGVRCGI